jgi:hypothetical protein
LLLLLRTSFKRLEVRVASSLAMQLQVSVELLTLFQGPQRFYWPFAFLSGST